MHVDQFQKDFAEAAERLGTSRFDLDLPASLPLRSFADVGRQDLPCHTKAATVASTAVFYHRLTKKGADSSTPGIEARLQDAAKYFQAHGVFQAIKQAMLAKPAEEMPDEKYAHVWVDGFGGKHRNLPLRVEEDVIKAAAWFFEYRDNLAFIDRVTVAEKIAAALDVYPVALPDGHLQTLERTLGRAECAPHKGVAEMQKRAALLPKDMPAREQLLSVAELLEKNAASYRDGSQLMKLAQLVDEFDTQFSLHRYYGDRIEMFEDAVFAKTASVMSADKARFFTLTNGAVFEKKAATRLNPTTLEEWLGDEGDFRSGQSIDVERFAEVAEKLAVADANRLESLMAGAGVNPVRHQSTWSAPSPDAWRKLAATA